jgi:hypothetical protein
LTLVNVEECEQIKPGGDESSPLLMVF